MGRELIKDHQIIKEERLWQQLPEENEAGIAPDTTHLWVTLEQMGDAELIERLIEREFGLGLELQGDSDPAEAEAYFDRLEAIAIAFPKFADGRGYSLARLLRERHGWRGELRARGEILRDQLFYLSRCGFNVLELQEGEDAERALSAFNDFSVTYQPAGDLRAPVYAHARPRPQD